MKDRILITGSRGLIGSALKRRLERDGYEVVEFDLRLEGGARDILDADALRDATSGVVGVIHLAAVSRVIWGELDPAQCRRVNIAGTRNVLEAVTEACDPCPWMIYASSREVYGEPGALPVSEDAPLAPLNVYGETKLAAERLVEVATLERGLRACVVRFSNVFGDVADHADRVVPAFARAAALGGIVRVDGDQSTFDFTCLDDVIEGLTLVVEELQRGGSLPPIHFVTGKPTTLGELADLAVEEGLGQVSKQVAPSRDFDVHEFYGSPERAQRLLGWRAKKPLARGFRELVNAFRSNQHANHRR